LWKKQGKKVRSIRAQIYLRVFSFGRRADSKINTSEKATKQSQQGAAGKVTKQSTPFPQSPLCVFVVVFLLVSSICSVPPGTRLDPHTTSTRGLFILLPMLCR
jgi:hypothetical protein